MKKMTIDGNTATVSVAYAFSDVAAIYPITPSTSMAEYADMWASQGRLNLFGQTVRVAEMQSEGGAAGAVHGSLTAGALTTTFTASQGLLLMIPNMYKIAGELLPTVFHISARTVAGHALSIFGDHSDVMSARQTGFAMLASNSVQEAMDMAAVAHLSTLRARVPFMHFFDGFRTSHEINKINALELDDLKQLLEKDTLDDINQFRASGLSPLHPIAKGTAQNPDVFFQNKEASNKYYDAVPNIVKTMMARFAKLSGRNYKLFDYYGATDATDIIIAIGSGCETIEETIDLLVSKGKKVGLVKVRLFRPFSITDFVDALPKTTKRIAVLDRCKEPGSVGEPLYIDVLTALREKGKNDIQVIGGRYGLGSKDFNPTQVNAIYKNLASATPKNHFTVGINDDVTRLSIDISEFINAAPDDTRRCKFYGLGSDGTVGANKNSIAIIGDHTELNAQGYFAYDSKKSGGITISHLRFGKKPIKSTYLIDQADFVACHTFPYVAKYDMLSELKDGGVFLLNTIYDQKALETQLPASVKQTIAKKNAKFYIINALKIAEQTGMGKHINTVMQAAFFKLADVIDYKQAVDYMKAAAKKTYAKKGEQVIQQNYNAIDSAIAGLTLVEYDKTAWAKSTTGATVKEAVTDKYFLQFIKPIQDLKGDSLPVSAFNPSGVVPTATTKYEKRGIAAYVPKWIPSNCIACNQCSLVCPHSVIRPTLLDAKQKAKAPTTFETIKPKYLGEELDFRIQISTLDCTGCSSCANVCPGKGKDNKALVMVPIDEQGVEIKNQEYANTIPYIDVSAKMKPDTTIGSQFRQSYFEYSGACAGCGETPYIKLVTQLFGDRMLIANATGCSSIYGGSAPTIPYSVDKNGSGPAWANSLFEDNAEFGYGFNLADKAKRNLLKSDIQKAIELKAPASISKLFTEWLSNMDDGAKTKELHRQIMVELPDAIKKSSGELNQHLNAILSNNDAIIKKSIWCFGGDGWAYDIGYGGLDHVLASGEDINILVVDTEVYSNTGGQSSKSTPVGSIAKFAEGGKRTKKKDLGLMAMSYGYVYVASIAMGANQAQTVKAIAEAEAYKGPSIIIAYSSCINHGTDMSNVQLTAKRAVETGYWNLYRYNPALSLEGKNPFILDSKDPTLEYTEFLSQETRYKALQANNPTTADALFKQAKQDAQDRLTMYKHLANK